MTTTTVANHWWWRPGWRPGRRMYTWHITFDGHPAVRGLAERTRQRLAGLPGLDLIPDKWLHLTTQGVGFTDEVTDADIEAITQAAQAQLKDLPPLDVMIGPARVASEGVAFGAAPHAGLTEIRQRLRQAIATVWSPGHVPEASGWAPHVSVAYSNTTGPADPYINALGPAAETAQATVDAVQLIVLGRDHHMYTWTTRATARLSRLSARTGRRYF